MLQTVIEARAVLSLAVAVIVGTAGLQTHPLDTENVFLAIIQLRAPDVFHVLTYSYALLWFSTPLTAMSFAVSLFVLVANRRTPTVHFQPLPPYPPPATRPEPSLVIGETHFTTRPGRAPNPMWLTIPQRGLYTGVLVVGATGTGKTSAAMYPFVRQLLSWRADDPSRRMGGLVMEVKGDFCRDVRAMLKEVGRETDYVELGLDRTTCYNPLHGDLDPYAVAYAIASLANNLFGKSKEPFWQQAYVDLLRFVILLRRLKDGYTTLSDVYRCCLDESVIDHDIRELKRLLTAPADVILLPKTEHALHCAQAPSTLWYESDDQTLAHPYSAELEEFLAGRQLAYRVQRGHTVQDRDRQHQVEAVERWFYRSWMRLDGKLRSSIVEGIVVVLGWFDADPTVYRTFCPPQRVYTNPLPGDPTPIPPLLDLFEAGRVLGVNFPVALNAALARMLAILTKLNTFNAMLRRIPIISAHPDRVYRNVLFSCDEYQEIASVGESDPAGDERHLMLTRQARLIPVVAIQSFSALRAALPGNDSWQALASCFRTTIALATNDSFTARMLADRCGKQDRLKPRFTVTEGGQQAHISLLTARPTAERQTLTVSKTYSLESDYVFQPRVFTELPTAQAVVVPFDGRTPHPAQYCYLKPRHLDVQTSYFDQVEQGDL
jgi:hypothetical protein